MVNKKKIGLLDPPSKILTEEYKEKSAKQWKRLFQSKEQRYKEARRISEKVELWERIKNIYNELMAYDKLLIAPHDIPMAVKLRIYEELPRHEKEAIEYIEREKGDESARHKAIIKRIEERRKELEEEVKELEKKFLEKKD